MSYPARAEGLVNRIIIFLPKIKMSFPDISVKDLKSTSRPGLNIVEVIGISLIPSDIYSLMLINIIKMFGILDFESETFHTFERRHLRHHINPSDFTPLLRQRKIRFSWRVCIHKNLIQYHHHHHHVVPPARISLTPSRHFSLLFIASGRSSGLHPVSSHSCCM